MAAFVVPKSTFFIISLLLFIQCSKIHGHGGGHDDGESGSDGVGLRSRGLVLVKIWCLIILFVTTFAGGISPYFCRWNETFLLLGTQFAGGVFLGTALMHFLSDSTETFSERTSKGYPFSFMLASVGYLLTMFGDCIVLFVTKVADHDKLGSRVVEIEDAMATHQEPAHNEDRTRIDHKSVIFFKTTSLGDTILLISALCFHSIFEGIAVGVAATKGDAWRNLWTISLHKIFAAIAMGIALLRMIPKRPFQLTAAYSFGFAISSPIGVGIGIAIDATTEGETADWIYAISMGLACGVFVYVAINHLIEKGFKPQAERNNFDTPFFKFLAVLLGVGVIAVVMIWDD